MYFLLNMGIFHCYISLPDGNLFIFLWREAYSPFLSTVKSVSWQDPTRIYPPPRMPNDITF